MDEETGFIGETDARIRRFLDHRDAAAIVRPLRVEWKPVSLDLDDPGGTERRP